MVSVQSTTHANVRVISKRAWGTLTENTAAQPPSHSRLVAVRDKHAAKCLTNLIKVLLNLTSSDIPTFYIPLGWNFQTDLKERKAYVSWVPLSTIDFSYNFLLLAGTVGALGQVYTSVLYQYNYIAEKSTPLSNTAIPA